MNNITKIYARTDKGFSGRGQQALVVEFFDTRPNGGDIKDLVRFLESHDKFSTVQSAERIAAYYICVLKKSGHVVLKSTSEDVTDVFAGADIDLELANGLKREE